ncbi:MAG: 50S ribosomal protein L25 [Anaerolineae bacterium]|nr:50S ribosomal protein L25 [Anaerolineae bacterium]
MEAIELHAEPRTLTGKKAKLLRRESIVPGVIYGRHIEPIAVQFEYRELLKALHRAGTSAAVQVALKGAEEPYLAIFRDVQHNPIRRDVTHVDLQALSLTETVRVSVNVVLVGTAPATEEAGGVVMQLLTELEIEALPTALIPVIEVDISGLAEVGDSIAVGDIPVPEGVEILNQNTETIVQITFMAEEELEAEVLEPELGVLGQPLEELGEAEEQEFDEEEEEA